MGFFTIDKKHESTYMKWGFLAGFFVTIISLLLEASYVFVTISLAPEAVPENINLFSTGGALLMSPLLAILHGGSLYFLLKKINGIVSDMNKWSVAIYMLGGVWITELIATSILEKALVLSWPGVLSIIITIVVPFLYKAK